jgi:hypothetical protein
MILLDRSLLELKNPSRLDRADHRALMIALDPKQDLVKMTKASDRLHLEQELVKVTKALDLSRPEQEQLVRMTTGSKPLSGATQSLIALESSRTWMVGSAHPTRLKILNNSPPHKTGLPRQISTVQSFLEITKLLKQNFKNTKDIVQGIPQKSTTLKSFC